MFLRRCSSSKFTFPIVSFNQEIKDFLNVVDERTLARQVCGEILNLFEYLNNLKMVVNNSGATQSH